MTWCRARSAKTLHPVPTAWRWTPYLGETLDAGMATLLAEETIEAVRFIYGEEPQPFSGIVSVPASPAPTWRLTARAMAMMGTSTGLSTTFSSRSWGIQLVDGRMPGFAAYRGVPSPMSWPSRSCANCSAAISSPSSAATASTAAHYPPAAGGRCGDGLRHLHRTLWHGYDQRRLRHRLCRTALTAG